jgi:hypothetical protein
MGKDAHILIHDNLDSNLVWVKVAVERMKELLYSEAPKTEAVIGNLPAGTRVSFRAITLLFFFFDPYWAYVINRLIITIVAFSGMLLLLKTHVLMQKESTFISHGVALAFSLLPFWPFGGLSVAGMPYVIFAFLNLRRNNCKWYNWLILILFPFYSALVLSGFFLLFTLGILWLRDIIVQKKFKIYFFLGLLVISAVYIYTELGLFKAFILPQPGTGAPRSHRYEMALQALNLWESTFRAIKLFLVGRYHAHTLHTFIVLPTVILSGWFFLKAGKSFGKKLFVLLMLFIISTTIFHGLYMFGGEYSLKHMLDKVFPMTLDRFFFLYPVSWMLLFGLALALIRQQFKYGYWISIMLIGLQIVYSFYRHEVVDNRNTPTYREFYAEKQFEEISDYIGKPQHEFRVGSIGIHPAVSQFNGFYTIDGYRGSYPLAYKNRFRQIISPELEKNETIRQYFDGWGSRFYLFSDDLAQKGSLYINEAGNDIAITALDFDWDAFIALGGRYLFSSVKIDERISPRVIFHRQFTHPESAWDIYLYEIR